MTVLILCLSLALILAAGATPIHTEPGSFNQGDELPTEEAADLDELSAEEPPTESEEDKGEEPAVSNASVEAAAILEKILAENKKPMDSLHRF